MSESPTAPLHCETILLAEDNEDHVILIRRAFKRACLLNPLHAVHDGAEAIAYLDGEGKYANRTRYPLPSLLLLDLRMPNTDGFQVMEWIQTQPALHLQIIVLTTSDRVVDVQRAYQLGASSFLVKPLDLQDFIRIGPTIKSCWTSINDSPVRLPETQHDLVPSS